MPVRWLIWMYCGVSQLWLSSITIVDLNFRKVQYWKLGRVDTQL